MPLRQAFIATGTKAARPQWARCLDDLRTGDRLIIWKIDRLGRNLRDLIDIVTTLENRGVGVQSLTNGIVDTTTTAPRQTRLRHVRPDGRIRGRVSPRAHPGRQAGLVAARSRGHKGGRKPKMTASLIGKAQRMYDAPANSPMAEIATTERRTINTNLNTLNTTRCKWRLVTLP